MQDWEQCRRNDLNLFKYAFNVIQNWETDALQTGAFCLLVVMVEGDESSRRFWSTTGSYWQPYSLESQYAVDWGILWSKIQLLQGKLKSISILAP